MTAAGPGSTPREPFPAGAGLLESTLGLDDARGGRPYLLVFQAGSMSVVPLVGDGVVTIGRDPAVDVPLEDMGVSRRHAELRLVEGEATIADLESANGTRLNGQALTAPAVLASGDVIGVGNAQIVFSRTAPEVRGPDVLDAGAFARRLHGEVERSLRYLRPLTLLLVGRGRRRSDDELLCEAILGAVRTMDAVGRLDATTLAVLMPELPPGDGRFVADRIFRVAVRADDAIRGGAASWPDDACQVDALLEGSHAALARAVAGELRTAEQAIEARVICGRTVVVADAAMAQLLALIERLAPTDLPILLTGETGVGKEIYASAVHAFSSRASRPFVAVNCAALPETLAESELFGHARGAFTGADHVRAGHLEAAHGGTLFLDEIGEMPLAVQAKLLRVLEDKRVVRLGETEGRQVDLRLVAATNRDLKQAVREGRFRGDLYYRLNAGALLVPPLRQRPREIPALARRFLADAAVALRRPALEIAAGAMRLLATYAWPGNVRELKNAMERAAAVATSDALEPWMLPPEIAGDEGAPAAPEAGARAFVPLQQELQELERRRIAEALEAAGGVQTRAAALLRMPLRTFYMKVKQYGLGRAEGAKDGT